jgi:transcriptional antiterminator RfaH
MDEEKKYKWHVIYTRSRQEKKIASELEKKGIHYYLPLIKTIKQWSDRKKKVEEVLFKSYIFVYVDSLEYMEAIKIQGAVKYVSIEGKAVQLSEKQIEVIRNTIENKLEFDLSTDYFKKGSLIKIKNGPLKGANGEIVSISGKKRLLVRINEIGYSLLVHLSPGDLI